MDQIEEVKRKTDIVELISETVELKRAGRNFKGLCPFHGEKTPSFMVTPELQIFKCFGCGLGGDCFRFVQEFEKVDFPQALKVLADRSGVKLRPIRGYTGYEEKEEVYRANFIASEFYHYVLTQHKAGEKARVYLAGRKVGKEAIEAFGLGYSPDQSQAVFGFLTKKRNYTPQILEKAGIVSRRGREFFDRFRGRVIFPLKDHLGNTLGFAGRVIEDKGEMAKYINSPDTVVYKKGRVLYGLDVARGEIKKAGRAIVVEGELDCISCWQAGIKNVVAIKGSALTPDQASLLSRFCTEVTLALDSDFAGDQAARRGLEVMKNQGFSIRVANLGEFKDPDEAAKNDPEGLKIALSQAEEVHDFLLNSIFKKHDVTSTEGKAKISREIAPILASIDDEIVRAHCVRVVAQRLQVPEDAVLAQVSKKEVKKETSAEESPAESPSRSRRNILEESLLSLYLTSDPEALLDKGHIFTSPAVRRLAEEFINFYKKGEGFNPALFSERLPAELVEFFASLMLLVEEQDPEKAQREISETLKNLEILEAKREIGKLTEKIRGLEIQGKNKDLEIVEEQLTQASAKLTQLESATP